MESAHIGRREPLKTYPSLSNPRLANCLMLLMLRGSVSDEPQFARSSYEIFLPIKYIENKKASGTALMTTQRIAQSLKHLRLESSYVPVRFAHSLCPPIAAAFKSRTVSLQFPC